MNLKTLSCNTSNPVDRQVDWHLLNRAYRGESFNCLFNLVAAAVLATVVASYSPDARVPGLWWVVMMFIVALRYLDGVSFRAGANMETMAAWTRRHVATVFATGLVWGVGAAIMIVAVPFTRIQAAIVVVVVAMITATISGQGPMRRVFSGFLLGSLLPLTLAAVFHPGIGSPWYGLLAVIFGGAMWLIAEQYNQDFRASTRLGYEKKELSERLAATNARLEADIDARLRAENLLSVERNILENVARQMSLTDVLVELNLDMEALYPESLCSVILLDESDRCVQHVIAPSLPESYTNALHGLETGPEVGSCGTAMYRKQQVVVEDIENSPLWRDYRGLAAVHDLRACWATPIVSRSGSMLGSFAIYRREPRRPSGEELETVNRLSRLIALVIEDIRSSDKIHLSEQRFRDFATVAADWFWEMSPDLRFVYVSDKPGQDVHGIRSPVLERTREELRRVLDGGSPGSSLETDSGAPIVLDFSVRTSGNPPIEVTTLAKPVFDTDHQLVGWRGAGRDITRERELEREIRYQAAHDSLTGLANRREFDDHLSTLLGCADQRQDRYVAFIDLDRFKMVNDTAGHHAGDAILKRTANIIKNVLPDTGMVARMGGDEFAASLTARDIKHAVNVMERLINSLARNSFEWNGAVFNIGASIGLVRITPAHKTTEQVMSDADACCYRSKHQGGNRVSLFQPDLDAYTDDARSTGELLRALKDSRTLLHVQQICGIQGSGHTPWYEVFIRCCAGEYKTSSASRLIPAAERYGQMGTVDIWVLEKTLEHWGELLANNLLRLSLNLSATSITHHETANELARLVEQASISPGALCFEITETAAVENLDGAARFMRDLRGLGCGFVIDNFGSGQSNFSYLRALPGDYLAIGGDYVTAMMKDMASYTIVDAIHKVGRAHGMQTLAKYVESPEILESLTEIGVDFAQGHYIGQAFPASELDSLTLSDAGSRQDSVLDEPA